MAVETIFMLVRNAVIVVLICMVAQIFVIFDRRVLKISRFCSLVQGNLTILSEIIKFTFKERISKGFFFRIVPIVILILSFLPVVAVPFCGRIHIGNLMTLDPEIVTVEYGAIVALLAMSIYSYFCAFIGFLAKNSKSVLNSFRMISHLLSDDILLILSLLGMVFIYKSFAMHEIVLAQESILFAGIPAWGIFTQPLGAIIFLFAIVMKSDRPPFSYSSSREEIGAGFESLFSSMSFVVVSFSKYIFTVTSSMVFVTLFLGGHGMIPGMSLLEINIPFAVLIFQGISFLIKTFVVVVVITCFRSARLQYERSVYLNWVVLMPLGLLNILITVLYNYHLGKI